MDSEDMPCGPCCVCDETVDHSRMGICADCGGAFHWGRCGGWRGMEHVCTQCCDEDQHKGSEGS